MVHLPGGDVSEAPMSERSFLAEETEHVFEPSIGTPDILHRKYGDASGPNKILDKTGSW